MERNIQTKDEFFVADAIQLLVDRGMRFTAPSATIWEDCGTPDALLDTNRYLLQQLDDRPHHNGAVFIPPVYIDPTATVTNSLIGPYASIGADAVVDGSIIRDSIIDEGATVQTAVLERSLVGRNAVLTGNALRVNVGETSEVDLIWGSGDKS